MKPYRLVATNFPVEAIDSGTYYTDEAVRFSETLVTRYQTARCLMPQDSYHFKIIFISYQVSHSRKTPIKTAILCVLIFKILRQIQESSPESFFSNK